MAVQKKFILKNGKKFGVELFDSAQELVKVNRERPHRHQDDTIRHFDHKESWAGVGSYEEAEKLLADGWEENIDKLKNGLKNVGVGSGKRVTFQNSVVGFAPVVPLALQNVPNCMINTRIKPIKAKVINLYYDITVSGATNKAKVFENGQRIMQAVLNLESQGYRVRLNAVQGYCGNNHEQDGDILVVKVKSENQPIDLKRIMFPFTHVSMFRVIGFAWYERSPISYSRHCYGKAMAHQYDRETCNEHFKEMFGKNAVYISGTAMKSDVSEIEKQLKGGE